MIRRSGVLALVLCAWTGLAWAQAVGPTPDGTPATSNPVRIGGKDESGNTRSIATDNSGRVKTNGSESVQPVSATSLPLPIGAATETTLGTRATEATLGTRALEAGGNLEAAATSLQKLDNWDESNRAKVNLIPGQTGIVGGTGATAANSPRVTLASGDGATWHSLISAASTNATNVKNSAGTLYVISVTNTNPAVRYIRFYNLSSAPTCSSATGIAGRFAIPGDATGAGHVINLGPFGIAFSTGISYCLTTGSGDTDNNAVAAGEVLVNLIHK
jgi:hypothetical protein